VFARDLLLPPYETPLELAGYNLKVAHEPPRSRHFCFIERKEPMHVRRFVWMNVLGLAFALLGPIPSSPAAEIDKYLPDDTQIVLHANIRQILESDLGKKYLMPQLEASIQGNPEAQQMLSAMGWDSFKDVSSFTMAASGASEHNWMILVHSHYDL